jgi:endonuclease III
MSLYRSVESAEDQVRFKLYRSGAPITLSAVLPLLENMGFEVIDQRPYGITPTDAPPVWINDFGLATAAPDPLESDRRSASFQEAFARVWHGETEDDGFNRLVLRAELTWRDVTLLRAYSKYLRQTATASKNKIRRLLSDYNADRRDLFRRGVLAVAKEVPLSAADRFVLEQLVALWQELEAQILELGRQLKSFAAQAPAKEAEARAKLQTIPGVGPVTVDVVLSELGDIDRFKSSKAVCAYAGLAPTLPRQTGDVVVGALSERDPFESFAMAQLSQLLTDEDIRERARGLAADVLGRALTAFQGVIADTDALKVLLAADAEAEGVTGEARVKQLAITVLEGHRRRIVALGLEDVDHL